MAIANLGRKTRDKTPATSAAQGWTHHPAILEAQRGLDGALKRLADRESAVRHQEELLERLKEFDSKHRGETPHNRGTGEHMSQIDVRDAETRLAEFRERAASAQEDVTRARRTLLDAKALAEAAAPADPAAIDWRVSPGLIAAQRAADEAETHLAELIAAAPVAAEKRDAAVHAAQIAEGGHRAGRVSEINRDRALDTAESARLDALRLESDRIAAEDHIQVTVAALARAQAAAKEQAYLALNQAYAAALEDLHGALDVAVAANARMDLLYRSAAGQFPLSQSGAGTPGGFPRAAGLDGKLIWPALLELGQARPTAISWWRRAVRSVGYQVAGKEA